MNLMNVLSLSEITIGSLCFLNYIVSIARLAVPKCMEYYEKGKCKFKAVQQYTRVILTYLEIVS